ncbi:tripartite tricarboxylate transporter TctB family protein [Methylopila sp. M107]|uniref:tripartite tricarboxylate transporter TctB family protein n=1 Tax=Methylopila sp. M107 TaxID=1101190 RepID=UPI0003717870|nr:tripartite tricarboxylate transporter TctB family protein [Methylopila sp. M107]
MDNSSHPAEGPSAGFLGGRLPPLFLLGFAVAYGVVGSKIEYSFSSDPLGPRVFPVLLSILLFVLSAFYLVKPGESGPWPKGVLLAKSAAMIALLVLSALLLEPFGFFISMLIVTGGFAWIFGASPLASVVSGAAQAGLWWFIFGYLLDVYLPTGELLKSIWS